MAPALPPETAAAAGRGRRASRASGDERERAILTTAESLLAERPLAEISVEDLARGAGISRPTFYFYFPSKDAVVLTLVDRMIEEATSSRAEVLGKLAEAPQAGWRRGIEAFFEAFGSRRAVTLAAADLRTSNEEVRRLWAGVMEGWVEEVAAIVEAERARGVAPPGVPARELAIALLQMNDRVNCATFAGEDPALPNGRVIDVLVEIWLRAIYGTSEPG